MTVAKKILVVDDSDVIREITTRIVADLGFSVAEAASGTAGIEVCQTEKPDFVLLDWDLPQLGALDFLRGAADLSADARPEIILCATENDPQQFTLAKAAGAGHYILKPFDRRAIEAKLQEVGALKSKSDGVSAVA